MEVLLLIPKPIFSRNQRSNLQSDNTVYPSNGPLKVPSNALGFIMFGLQYEFTDYNVVISYLKGFDPNEHPTGTAHGAVHCSEQLPPQFFTFAVHLDGSLFKEGIESRYHHLYSSIDFDLTEDEKAKNILSIKSIKLTESLYKITNIGEKYTVSCSSLYRKLTFTKFHHDNIHKQYNH